MTWQELILHELGPIPMFMWQYAAVLGVLAVTLIVTRPIQPSAQQSNTLYAAVLAGCGYIITVLLHIYVPPPSSAPIRYDLLFLAGMMGGWRGGLLGFMLIYGARFQVTGSAYAILAAIDMGTVSLGGVIAHRWYARMNLADLSLKQILGLWAWRSIVLVLSGAVLVALHKLPAGAIFFDLLPYKNSVGSLVRKTLMAGPALLFFVAVLAMFRLDAGDRRRQTLEWRNSREDSLTQLPNRRALSEHLDRLLRMSSSRNEVALISMGASNHAQLLLQNGHEWSGTFLTTLAKAVTLSLSNQSLACGAKVYQFGDLNLVLMLYGKDVRQLENAEWAEQLHHGLSLKLRELQPSGPLPVLAITVLPCDSATHPQAATLLRNLALHLHNQSGERRHIHLLTSNFAHAARREEWLLVELGNWIDSGRPPLAYMPKCALPARELVGAEALLRCQDDQGRSVSPGEILALASRHRLLGAFEWATLEQVCRDAAYWVNAGHPRPLSVNISSTSLVTPGFAHRLLALMAAHSLNSHSLTLELTEYDAVPDIDVVRENVELLTARDIKLSLDDFGNGYSGLSVLARIPFSEVKVDRSMTAMVDQPRMRAAIALALESARRYDAELVAEGVETEEQARVLLEIGVIQAQGHLFAKALSVTELVTFNLEAMRQQAMPPPTQP